MKQTLHIIAYAAVALALLSSCAKEEFKENAIPAGEKIEVCIMNNYMLVNIVIREEI